uniref:Uncharacterized protein n=1 Tax=Candidatus Kentrum sp. LPFa TaxID=2126335 RepID=A0A450Y183_9GAMM|nr:MAG: hypothetical protein BECKLPF1236A_GA0070988_103542 [Candidatus Kentron sp. LPFa]VFK35289.1 MAG: hypothetical protein BECKLPF1236C_GA0070990_103552 [Candidatus Kentron sp. LPFa]
MHKNGGNFPHFLQKMASVKKQCTCYREKNGQFGAFLRYFDSLWRVGTGYVGSWSLGASNTGYVELSPVLRAMGIAAEVGMGAARFSLGAGTTIEEIDTVLDGLSDVFS